MTTRWARFTRGWLGAVFSTFVAALSHTAGGGSGPGLLPVALCLAFAVIVCIGLAGRSLSLWRPRLAAPPGGSARPATFQTRPIARPRRTLRRPLPAFFAGAPHSKDTP